MAETDDSLTARDERRDRIDDLGLFDAHSASREELLSQLALICDEPLGRAWLSPLRTRFGFESEPTTLEQTFAHHPDSSIRELLGRVGDITRALAQLAGPWDARPFSRLCFDISSKTVDECRHTLRERLVADDLVSAGDEELVERVADESSSACRVEPEHLLDQNSGEPLVGHDKRTQVWAQSGSRFAGSSFGHPATLLIGALIGAGAVMMLRRSAKPQGVPAQPDEAA